MITVFFGNHLSHNTIMIDCVEEVHVSRGGGGGPFLTRGMRLKETEVNVRDTV